MSLLSSILKSFVGDKAKKDLKSLYPLVDKIHQATKELDGLTHDQLRDQTNNFKREITEIRKPIFDKIDMLNETIRQTVDVDEKETNGDALLTASDPRLSSVPKDTDPKMLGNSAGWGTM